MRAEAALPSTRDDAIDLVRGAVMALMALDHARDFFGHGLPRPTDLDATWPALFFTRWVTHFCAPTFVLLAGAGAHLSLARGKSRGELSRFLLTRGLWLVLLEVTVVRAAWQLDLRYAFTTLQVIWALGVSMVVLSALVHLPLAAAGAFGALLVVGHNALDGVASTGALWSLLHHPARLALGGATIHVFYPIVPWVGVMACGYALGPTLERPLRERRRALLLLGGALTVAFVALRALAIYGDPHPFAAQPGAMRTLLAFLSCEKYPPSLDYLLMTLGPTLCALGLLAGRAPRLAAPLVTLGRVPLFYYVAHLYLIHGAAFLVGADQRALGLAGVYAAWLVALALLYPACRWYAALKRRRADLTWLSYL
jgi:uncharacterized membrane protein